MKITIKVDGNCPTDPRQGDIYLIDRDGDDAEVAMVVQVGTGSFQLIGMRNANRWGGPSSLEEIFWTCKGYRVRGPFKNCELIVR